LEKGRISWSYNMLIIHQALLIININNDFYCLDDVKYRHIHKVNDYMPSAEFGTWSLQVVCGSWVAFVASVIPSNGFVPVQD
ncbi:MAG: hypothetical protein WCN98_13480, partial [Verrucomicrobiaceae bacterium]